MANKIKLYQAGDNAERYRLKTYPHGHLSTSAVSNDLACRTNDLSYTINGM